MAITTFPAHRADFVWPVPAEGVLAMALEYKASMPSANSLRIMERPLCLSSHGQPRKTECQDEVSHALHFTQQGSAPDLCWG